MNASEQTAFGEILLFVAGALLVLGGGTLTSTWLRPHNPNPIKLSTYESGELTVGSAWSKFDTRFYVLAVVFVLCEIETLLLLPWATVWANPALSSLTSGLWIYYTLASGLLFIALLAVGWVYVWRQGCFASIPLPPVPKAESTVPCSHYEQVNRRYAAKSTKSQPQSPST